MMLYLLLLLKSFKLEIRFINIQQDTLTFTHLIPVHQNFIRKISILFQGPRIWNSLPNIIKNAPTFNKGQTRYNLNTLTPYIYIFL